MSIIQNLPQFFSSNNYIFKLIKKLNYSFQGDDYSLYFIEHTDTILLKSAHALHENVAVYYVLYLFSGLISLVE